MRIYMTMVLAAAMATAASAKTFTVTSPDSRVTATIDADAQRFDLSASADGALVLGPSPLSVILSDGTVIGPSAKVRATGHRSVDTMIPSPLYRSAEVRDNFNELTLRVARDWDVVVRAYNDGVADRKSVV